MLYLLGGAMFKTVLFIAAMTVTTAPPKEPMPVETITITKALAEKLVQQSIALQTEIARLKQEAYLYQMLPHEERQKMCA